LFYTATSAEPENERKLYSVRADGYWSADEQVSLLSLLKSRRYLCAGTRQNAGNASQVPMVQWCVTSMLSAAADASQVRELDRSNRTTCQWQTWSYLVYRLWTEWTLSTALLLRVTFTDQSDRTQPNPTAHGLNPIESETSTSHNTETSDYASRR